MDKIENLNRIFVTTIIVSVIILSCKENTSNKSNSNLNTSDHNDKTEMIHRCGRTWNGDRDATYGVYGDYCSLRCYGDLYPN